MQDRTGQRAIFQNEVYRLQLVRRSQRRVSRKVKLALADRLCFGRRVADSKLKGLFVELALRVTVHGSFRLKHPVSTQRDTVSAEESTGSPVALATAPPVHDEGLPVHGSALGDTVNAESEHVLHGL